MNNRSILYGVARDGTSWFWYAENHRTPISILSRPEFEHGWAKTLTGAMTSARATATRLAAGRAGVIVDVSHARAKDHLRRVWIDWRLAHGSDLDTVKAARPVDVAALKVAMVKAHPDRGGTAARFVQARAAYVAARQRQPSC